MGEGAVAKFIGGECSKGGKHVYKVVHAPLCAWSLPRSSILRSADLVCSLESAQSVALRSSSTEATPTGDFGCAHAHMGAVRYTVRHLDCKREIVELCIVLLSAQDAERACFALNG